MNKNLIKKKSSRKSLLLVTLLVSLCFVFTNASHAQNNTKKGQAKVTLNVTNTSISDILNEIEKQTLYTFIYDNSIVNVNEKVTVKFQDKTIFDALAIVFKGKNIESKFSDQKIILSKGSISPEKQQPTQQTGQVSGMVTDESNNPVIGANISIQGTKKGAFTDENGKFIINAEVNNVLQISYLGYIKKEIKVSDRHPLKIVLEEDVQSLDAVVVVGYGTLKKKDLTGAVSVVNTKTLSNAPTTSILESISGSIPGVEINMNGRPGDTGFATIRGINNFTSVTPLYVIDGILTTNIRDINSLDIESIQILKDASAAAIYGSRAANGVIVITTKSGSEGPMRINFSSSYTIQDGTPPIKLANAEEYILLNKIGRENAGLSPLTYNSGVDTDWIDEVMNNGSIQQYNLSVSGGSNTGKYYVSGEYFKNKGIYYGTEYDRFNFRVNTSGVRGILSYGQTLNMSNNVVDPNSSGLGLGMCPLIPVYDENHVGGYGFGDPNTNNCIGENPIAVENLNKTINTNFRIMVGLWAELKILKSLTYKLNTGYTLNFDGQKTLRKEGDWRMNMAYEPSSLYESRGRFDSPLVENTLSYINTFGKHSINAVLGQTFQKENYETINGKIYNILRTDSGKYYEVLGAGTDNAVVGGYANIGAMLSYLGRANYTYDDKYLLSLTLRADASSRVKKENRWGYFPSFSGAWRIQKEKFMEDLHWISDLKLRASHGTLGNLNIGYYDYLPLINTNLTATFGTDQKQQQASIQTNLTNEDIKWESQTQTNFGLDMSFLDNRLTSNIDYYISNTNDILVSMPILLTTGNGAGDPIVNAASLKNSGLEISVGWRDSKEKFSYFTNFNVNIMRNKVTGLGYGRDAIIVNQARTAVGRPVSEFFLIRTDGLFQSDEDVQSYVNSNGTVIQPTAKPGDIKYVDYNDDGKITDADRQIVGNAESLFLAGFNAGISWNNFDVKMNWFGDFGCDIFNSLRRYMIGLDSGSDSGFIKGFSTNYWTPENNSSKNPRPVIGTKQNSRDSEYWLEDGSYLKLKSLSIGYNIPKSLLNKIGVNSCRMYVNGQNLITLTKFSMGDPEYRKDNIWNRNNRGIDAYPNPKAVNVGIQIEI